MADQFITYQGKQYSANQAYEYAKSKGYSKSFAEFLNEYGTPEGKTKFEKILEKSGGILDTIKDLIGGLGNGSTPVNVNDPAKPTPTNDKSTKILGIPKGAAIAVGILVLGLATWGVVTIIKNSNK